MTSSADNRTYGNGFSHPHQVLQSALAIPQLPVLIALVHLIGYLDGGDHQHDLTDHRDEQRRQVQKVQACAQHGLKAHMPAGLVFIPSRHSQHPGVVAQLVLYKRAQVNEQRNLDGKVAPIQIDWRISTARAQSRQRSIKARPIPLADEA